MYGMYHTIPYPLYAMLIHILPKKQITGKVTSSLCNWIGSHVINMILPMATILVVSVVVLHHIRCSKPEFSCYYTLHSIAIPPLTYRICTGTHCTLQIWGCHHMDWMDHR